MSSAKTSEEAFVRYLFSHEGLHAYILRCNRFAWFA